MTSRHVSRIAALAVLLSAGACTERTLVGPEAQQAFEEQRERVRVHGTSVDLSARPLFFVNGVEVKDGDLEKLDASAISRIEVIKGERAFGKYGEKAVHGAVLIYTKESG